MPKTTHSHLRFSNPAEGLYYRTEWNSECLEFTGHRDIQGYGKINVKGRGMLAHRYAWELENGPIPDEMMIDHRCHNPSCISIEHLRLATNKLNMEHQVRAHKNNKSGVRGVYWQAQRRKWAAQVRHNKKSIYLGLFLTIEEAEAAVKAKRLELFTYNDWDRQGVSCEPAERLGAGGSAV